MCTNFLVLTNNLPKNMGVRGLTSYIARHAELYLQPFELHDCNLVIDGDNLACNLYRSAPECNSAFGGDYDEFYRTVVEFYQLLLKCNVRPFVLLDGGYEQKKMRTVEKRLRSKIGVVKHLDPSNCNVIFPLMMREVFVNASRDCGVVLMRCIFEADDELAVLARRLNCPLISYDSDFYIHNVKYIPIVTLTTKILSKKDTARDRACTLSLCEARKIKKRHTLKLHINEGEIGKENSAKSIKYLDCCMYRIENLVKGVRLKKDLLPLFAALLGNDYIDSFAFRKFYDQVPLRKGGQRNSKQQRRIAAILRWLKYETKETATQKILGRLKKENRQLLLSQIECATSMYGREKSAAFDYFGLDDRERQSSSSEDEVDSIGDLEVDEDTDENQECENSALNSQTDESGSEVDSYEGKDPSVGAAHSIPEWVEVLILSGKLPRFCVDLVHQNLYINSPQIENFLYPDCNEVALPILRMNHFLLHYPEPQELRYLTRMVRITNVHYKRFEPLQNSVAFDPNSKNLQFLKEVFRPLQLNVDDLFKALNDLPAQFQLYFLAIIYWANESQYMDAIHLYCLVLCAVVISTIDEKVLPIRHEEDFYKKYRKTIQKARAQRESESAMKMGEPTSVQKSSEIPEGLPPIKKIKFVSKVDCILVQERLLKYFSKPNFYRKQHTEFSSSAVHAFSEFQAVVLQLHTLNAIIGSWFEEPPMGQMFSGVFLYNLYIGLHGRTDVMHYLENFVLQDSEVILQFYQFLLDWCKPFVSRLWDVVKENKSKRRRRRKKKTVNNRIEQVVEKDATDSSDEFCDLNNKFCSLLQINS